MKEFIDALFDEKNKIVFQYEDYDMSFYSGEFGSYYLIFYITKEEELIRLWENTGDIFRMLKESASIYKTEMDKNTTCVYCLQTTDEDYYETGKTGTISELSKKVSKVEEDLNYFSKHVFLYTENMKQFAARNAGYFEKICKDYLTKEHFQNYKNNIQKYYEYDFIINLFIKFPFLNFKKYYIDAQKEINYRSASSFIEEKFKENKIDQNGVQSIIASLESNLDDEDKFFKWLDEQAEA